MFPDRIVGLLPALLLSGAVETHIAAHLFLYQPVEGPGERR
jgi:hypothetical protein